MKNILLIILWFISFEIFSQTPYIVMKAGNIPVLLSAPHGGKLKPKQFKTRTGDDYKIDADTWTKEILLDVEKELIQIWGKPYCVYSNLHRSKIDFNREIFEATDSNKALFLLYYNYHAFIKEVSSEWLKKVLIVDIHAHRHSENLIELGYGLDYTMIEELDKKNSIYWNSNSFGYLFNKLYGKSICYPPSATIPSLYFRGGYIVKQKYDNTFNIQIELPKTIRMKSAYRDKAAKIIAKTIKEFYNLNFNNIDGYYKNTNDN